MAAPTDPPTHEVTGARGRRPGHGARPLIATGRLAGLGAGVLAVAVGIGVGTAALLRSPETTTRSAVTSAQHITVTAPVLPLTARQITDLLGRPPDYGALRDPVRRGACLAGLGYPSTTPILGARPLAVGGRPGVVLLLGGETADAVTAIAVADRCNAADTGLLASTSVRRP